MGGSGARPLVSTRSMWLFSSTPMVTGVGLSMPNNCEEIADVNIDHGELGDVLTIGFLNFRLSLAPSGTHRDPPAGAMVGR